MASATVSFGLVSIPVKLYSATESSSAVSFNMLHGKDGGRLKQSYNCSVCGEKVDRQDTVKGYEFAKDHYVQFTVDELKQLEEKATQAIEIAEFVPLKAIDPVYFDRPYYLGPDKGGAKAYSLLGETMKKTGRAALATYAARGKQYLVLIRPHGKGLVMQQLLYADEVRPISEVPLDETAVKDAELKLAVSLVDQISNDKFEPEKYKDEVRARILEQIQRKVDGQEFTETPTEQGAAPIIDLMEALKASLGGAGKKAAASASGAEAARKPAKQAPRNATRQSRAAGKK
jgi:DNA end-binding protein Ku